MKLTVLTLVISVALTVAAPTQQSQSAPPGACTFSANEKLNLGHNHDVNTGKIKLGGKVNGRAPQIGGSGCSPAWANGGSIDDNTPQKTRKECQRGKECSQ
jgi:hypothetical protein